MYFTQFKIETNKSRVENIDRLREFICTEKQPKISYHFDFKGKPFFGTISENKFDIMPVVEGRNSFVPVMNGEIIGDNQSIIVVKMRLHILVIALIVFITLFILWTLRNGINNNGGIVILSVTYLVMIVLYLRESKKYKRKFESYFY